MQHFFEKKHYLCTMENMIETFTKRNRLFL